MPIFWLYDWFLKQIFWKIINRLNRLLFLTQTIDLVALNVRIDVKIKKKGVVINYQKIIPKRALAIIDNV